MRELEIVPEPGDPAIAAAIARALEQLEREQGLTAAPAARALGLGGRRTRRARRRWPRLTSSSASASTRPCASREGAALHGERHLERITASAHALGLPAPERGAFAAAIAGAGGSGEVVRVRLHAPDGEAELQAERRAAVPPSRCA